MYYEPLDGFGKPSVVWTPAPYGRARKEGINKVRIGEVGIDQVGRKRTDQAVL